MPTITISDEQAADLAAGKSISIVPEPPERTYIVVGSKGAVYEFKTTYPVPRTFRTLRVPGTSRRLRNGTSGVGCVGFVRTHSFSNGYSADNGGYFVATKVER